MPANEKTTSRRAYVIIDSTALPRPSPAWLDQNGHAIYFESQREAQVEIAEWMIDKLNEFIAGERDFDDATTCHDFVFAVDLDAKPQARTSQPASTKKL